PLTALVAVGHVRKDRRILDWNADLIVKAVVDPALNLLPGAEAAVHRDVEGMMDVITRSFGAQLLLEFLFAPGRLRHSVMSIPSYATSIPAASSSRRSGDS